MTKAVDPVTIVAPALVVPPSGDNPNPVTPLPATTTHQQDLTTAGQRKVNMTWEYTQSFIAMLIVVANLTAALYIIFTSKESQTLTLAFSLLGNSLFLVIGFYFSRTNHQAIGGVGPKPDTSQVYVGR